jgi:hypothetical protein
LRKKTGGFTEEQKTERGSLFLRSEKLGQNRRKRKRRVEKRKRPRRRDREKAEGKGKPDMGFFF